MPSEPMTLSHLTRTQLAGRIWAVRRALDELQAQADADGQGAIPGYGSLKVSLIHLENELRDRDRQQEVAHTLAGEPARHAA
jgi:hypothetical protein